MWNLPVFFSYVRLNERVVRGPVFVLILDLTPAWNKRQLLYVKLLTTKAKLTEVKNERILTKSVHVVPRRARFVSG